MASLRIVQEGSGAVRPLVLVYHLNAAVDPALREAAGPNATIANTTAPGSVYADIPSLDTTLAQLAQALGGGVRFSPIVAAGFSAGGFATRTLLERGGRAPDAVVVADGTYATAPPQWAAWERYANDARLGRGVFVASHTSYVAPASNTWHVLKAITGWDLPLGPGAAPRPPDVPLLHLPFERRQAGNLVVYSYDGTHNAQGAVVLSQMIAEALGMTKGAAKKRWGWVGVTALAALATVGGFWWTLHQTEARPNPRFRRRSP